MNKGRRWSNAIGSLMMLAVLFVMVLAAQDGIDVEARAPMLTYLTEEARDEAAPDKARVLVAYNEDNPLESPFTQTLTDTLSAMRIPWAGVALDELCSRLENGAIQEAYLCVQDLTPLTDETARLMAWVENGGRLALMMTPADNDAFRIMHRKLGVVDAGAGYVMYTAVRFEKDGMLPLWDAGSTYSGDGELNDYTLAVRLEADCDVLLSTGDESAFPLLWTRDIGRGRVAVNDTTLTSGKDSRGLAAMTVAALRDVTVYPIINSGMIFIDDFPAPQPEGVNQALMDQFGYDIHGFYRNHWWPDMKSLTWDNGVRYTGVLVETYNDRVTPPFEPDGDERALTKYYASELLHAGGEVGLHGYNHMPLCPDGFQYADEDYVTWPSESAMAQAVSELTRYGEKFLPGTYYKTYVPPSNYLSPEGQRVLLQTAPNLRTISGLYLPEIGYDTLLQEFREEADGSISVPRITSGFTVSEYDRFVLAEELLLHGVFSHFIHPDDVMDAERSKGLTWDVMFQNFSGSIEEIGKTYPALRWSTASEGAAAVQRYDRLTVSRTESEDRISLALSPFYDEAWLALITEKTITSVENAVLYPVGGGLYWLKAEAADVCIYWEAET